MIQGQVGTGTSIGPPTYKRACHPAAVVTLNMASGVKGTRASFSHDVPQIGPTQRGTGKGDSNALEDVTKGPAEGKKEPE